MKFPVKGAPVEVDALDRRNKCQKLYDEVYPPAWKWNGTIVYAGGTPLTNKIFTDAIGYINTID